jgi:hypothetical protein
MSDSSISRSAAEIVRALSRLEPALIQDATRAAKAQRQRRIVFAIQAARELLAGYSLRQAAEIIDDIARGRRTTGLPSALRIEVVQALTREMGTLGDMPKFERIRQLIE